MDQCHYLEMTKDTPERLRALHELKAVCDRKKIQFDLGNERHPAEVHIPIRRGLPFVMPDNHTAEINQGLAFMAKSAHNLVLIRPNLTSTLAQMAEPSEEVQSTWFFPPTLDFGCKVLTIENRYASNEPFPPMPPFVRPERFTQMEQLQLWHMVSQPDSK